MPRTVGARSVVLIGDARDWPPDFETLLIAEGYASGHLPDLEAVIPIVEKPGVRALFVVARPLGGSDLSILRRIRQTSPRTGIVVVARSPTDPDLKRAFESGATAFLSWPASRKAVRQAVDSGSSPAGQRNPTT